MKRKFGNSTIEIVEGDITLLDRDAIVNAANDRLIMGGGVAGAILSRGGPSIQKECDAIGGTVVGGAVITGGGKLTARHVIHAVGPRMGEGDEELKLKNATLNSLALAEHHGLRSLSFPAVSAGIFGFPIDRCARIMLTAASEQLAKGSSLETVTFCLYDAAARKIFETALEALP